MGEGVKWLLACLAFHPAYPVWNGETQRFLPLWLRLEKMKVGQQAQAARKGSLAEVCGSLKCAVCPGEKIGGTECGPLRCVNVGCSDEVKHNCIAHLCNVDALFSGSDSLTTPVAHARSFFGPPERGAVKALPSGIDTALRDEPRLLYEDDDLAVVLKPPGWACAPNPQGVNAAWVKLKPLARRAQVGELLTAEKTQALQAWLLLHFGADPTCDASRDPGCDRGLAHRLDVETSGPLLVGKTVKGVEHLKKQIVIDILKDYIVLVHGTFSMDRGECHAPIDASTYTATKRVRVNDSGQAASTIWEALAEYESPEDDETYTLVHCRMVTLRTHQIRVHMQHLGHPLVGDPLYGTGDRPAFCPRMFVHKVRVGFFNLRGQACIETASLQTAPDLWQALGSLRKAGGMAMMGCGAPGL